MLFTVSLVPVEGPGFWNSSSFLTPGLFHLPLRSYRPTKSHFNLRERCHVLLLLPQKSGFCLLKMHFPKPTTNLVNQSWWCLQGLQGFPGDASGKEPTCQCRRHKSRRFDPWVGKTPWRKAWQTTPVVFFLENPHGQRSLEGYSPWGCKEPDRTKVTEHAPTGLTNSLGVFTAHQNLRKSIRLKVKVLATQLCLTLCNPMDCSPPGFSVHGILQARILEWVALSFSRGSSPPSDQTPSPVLQTNSLPSEPRGKPLPFNWRNSQIPSGSLEPGFYCCF